jgi:hypothetical protein
MYTEEYKNTGDLYKAKTFRTIHIKSMTKMIMNMNDDVVNIKNTVDLLKGGSK